MTRREMMRRLDADELLEWEALEQVDPFGQLRDDFRMAFLAEQIGIFFGTKKENGERFRLGDLLLQFPGLDTPDDDDDDDEEDHIDHALSEQEQADAHVKKLERDILTWVKAINQRFQNGNPKT